MNSFLVAIIIIVGFVFAGKILSKFVRNNGRVDEPIWLVGGLASLLVVPAFFWLGNFFFHVRITPVALLALLLVAGILFLLKKK